jgi:hypothetical protein
VWTCRWVQMYRRNLLPPSLALKIETVNSSETPTYKCTRRDSPEEQDSLHLFRTSESVRNETRYT